MPSSQFGPVALIVNAHARQGEQSFERIRQNLQHCGIPLMTAQSVTDVTELNYRVDEAVNQGAKVLLVGGGDGTLSTAAGRIAGKDVALGVLPLGTGNDFARSLGIPVQLPQACALVSKGKLSTVDVGLVNGKVFLNAVSAGLPVSLALRLTSELKQRYGKLAYAVAGTGALKDLRPFRLKLTTGSQRFEGEVLQWVVGNGRFHGAGQIIAPKAEPDDRRLDIYAVHAYPGDPKNRFRRFKDILFLTRMGVLGRRGAHVDHPRVEYFRAQQVTIETSPVQKLNVDGELDGQTPATFKLGVGALKVLVPES